MNKGIEGFKRENEAIGYSRAYNQIIKNIDSIDELMQYIPFDLASEIKKSGFAKPGKLYLNLSGKNLVLPVQL